MYRAVEGNTYFGGWENLFVGYVTKKWPDWQLTGRFDSCVTVVIQCNRRETAI